MFRNPRENASRTVSNKLIPSTGRAPSPPRSSDGKSTTITIPPPIIAKMPSKIATTPVAKAAPSPNTTKASKTNVKAAKGKPQEKGNGNIMAFFRKMSEANQSLFLDDAFGSKSSGVSFMPSLSRESSTTQSAVKDIEVDDETRFNESTVPSKRRKLSDVQGAESEEDRGSTADGQDVAAQDSANTGVVEAGSTTKSQVKSPRRIGPFLDDSDSDDEIPTQQDQETIANDRSDQPVIDEDEDLVAVKQKPFEEEEPPEGTEDITQEFPPHLKHEATSYGDIGGFEDFEGAEEEFDEEYAEGEEFSERRWAKEQRRLEKLEGGIENDAEDDDFREEYEEGDSSLEESLEAMPPNGIPACPICSISLGNVSAQDASVHVNNCLDGNPTPLPEASIITKVEEIKIKTEGEEERPSGAAKFKRAARPAKPGQENPFLLGASEAGGSAFSKIMCGNNEEAAWASAAAAEHASRGKPAFQRTCPFYKIMPGFYICVDAFRYGGVQGCNAYFLSHFHSDHYIGLTSTWSHGPIYCSRVTANLVRQQLRVDPKYVVDLEWETKTEVPGTRGVFVTMIPANHCPGSSLYLFEKVIPTGPQKSRMQRVLHCGDFRACPAHVEHPLLKPDVVDAVTGKTRHQKIDVCYLDTTYLNPKYAFPSQEDVIQACADMCVSLNKVRPDESDGWETMKRERAGAAMAKFVRKDSKEENASTNSNALTTTTTPFTNSKTQPQALTDAFEANRGPLLVVVGTYSIGKERICVGIANALGSKIYAPAGKRRIVAALEDPELSSLMTADPYAAQVHMTPLFEIRAETLGDYLNEYKTRFTRCVGFRPSGWNYRPPGSRFTESPSVNTVLYSDNWKSGFSMKDLSPQRGSTSKAICMGVPYSEHSSFRELTMFCSALRIEKVIPTVNVGSKKGRAAMQAWIERWKAEQRKSGLFQVVRNEETEIDDRSGKKVQKKGAWYAGRGTWALRTSITDSTAVVGKSGKRK